MLLAAPSAKQDLPPATGPSPGIRATDGAVSWYSSNRRGRLLVFEQPTGPSPGIRATDGAVSWYSSNHDRTRWRVRR